jgi:uncharacterized protein
MGAASPEGPGFRKRSEIRRMPRVLQGQGGSRPLPIPEPARKTILCFIANPQCAVLGGFFRRRSIGSNVVFGALPLRLALTVWLSVSTGAAAQELRLHSAGPGSAFLPYAQGLAAHLNARGAGPVIVVETAGSIANVAAVEADPRAIGFTVLASAQPAVESRAAANVRALFAMYRTGYHGVALRGRNVGRVLDLDAKRVGVGPAGGPAELFFGAIARDFHVKATAVTGTPAELGQALLDGRIDAFFQGAIVPIPAIATVADRADARVFGLSAWEIAGLVERYRYLSPMIVPARTYRGQDVHLATVASWNFAVVHKDMPDSRAEAILRAVLQGVDPAKDIHPFAAETRAANAAQNRVIPFHPAALRFHREMGIALR